MRYLITIIGTVVVVLYVYYNSGTEVYGGQYFLIQKAQSLAEKELQSYIKVCDDGYYYFAHQVTQNIFSEKGKINQEIIYERITDYDITIIPANEKLGRSLSGIFTTKKQEVYRDGRWKMIYEDILAKNDLQILFQINNEEELTIVNPFETVRGHSYILQSDFDCPNK